MRKFLIRASQVYVVFCGAVLVLVVLFEPRLPHRWEFLLGGVALVVFVEFVAFWERTRDQD